MMMMMMMMLAGRPDDDDDDDTDNDDDDDDGCFTLLSYMLQHLSKFSISSYVGGDSVLNLFST